MLFQRILFLLIIFISTSIIYSCNPNESKTNIMNDSSKSYTHTNNLINEKSPYLLQHAHNPVNWFPWGEEAFEKARKENKPIFLSIGYSTCHWCHVMEHESFEDQEVADLMNQHFVSIKVDREERPDIDNIYMSVCQMMTGSGGWPLTVVLRPDKKPFFAGTYFPKHSRQGRIGMLDLVTQLADAWKNKKTEIDKSAEEITQYLNVQSDQNIDGNLSDDILDKAYNTFNKQFDKQYGGFGNSRKFPSPHNLLFLLHYWETSGNETALTMVTKTLTEMRKGGIFDHVGFGFHRYSTESNWFLPHFEKMLYDQAMLLLAYTEAYQATGVELFKQTAEEIIEYTTRDMTSQEGGFYSAEDADSEGEEGKFYVWNKKEVIRILGKEDGEWFSKIYNLTDKGTYHEEASGKATGQNIPFLTQTFDELKIPIEEVHNKIQVLRTKLFDVREKRIHPYKDDKILTDWNGLMIAALSKAGRILDESKYINTAEKSVQFIFSKLIDADGNLLHRFREGEAGIKAQIDDYSFLIWGLLELYESTFKLSYLEKAIDLTNVLITDFWDTKNNSGFYFTGKGGEELIARPKEFYDGAIPSGNSVMYSNLLRLGKLTAQTKYDDFADNLGLAFKKTIEQNPTSSSQFLDGLTFSFSQSYEVIIVGDREDEKTKEMIEAVNSNYIPNKVLILIDTQTDRTQLTKLATYTESYISIDGKPTAYVCKNHICNLPTTDVNKMMEMLNN